MAEYLSPGVYVEEADTGNKPIEGVSTSTAGVVGVTERGPANVPTLVTSFGDYRRIFGGYLPINDFTDPSGRAHCYLPHAVEGMFVNGGKRLYVTRVTADEATRADRRLFFDDLAAANPDATVLLRAAEESTGTLVNPPLLYALSVAGLGPSDFIRIGDGSRSEYRTILNTDATQRHVSLDLPLQGSHAIGGAVTDIVRTADPGYGGPFTLPSPLTAGSAQIVVASLTPVDVATLAGAVNQLVEIGASPAAEYVLVVSALQLNATQVQITLAHPLQRDHASTDIATPLLVGIGGTQNLVTVANGGDSVLYLDALGGNFTNTTHLAVIDSGVFPNQEVRRIGTLSLFTPALPPYENYPIGSIIEHVTTAADTRTVAAGATLRVIPLNSVALLVPGMELGFTVAAPSSGIIQSVDTVTNQVTLLSDLGAAPAAASIATVQPRELTAAAGAGAMTIQLDARIGLGLAASDDVLRIGVAPNHDS